MSLPLPEPGFITLAQVEIKLWSDDLPLTDKDRHDLAEINGELLPLSRNTLRLCHLAREAGFSSLYTYLEHQSADSVCDGLCLHCGTIQDCEPDASENICEECDRPKVRSSLRIAGFI